MDTIMLAKCIIITTNRNGNKPSCVLKVTLFSYCLIPGKSNCGTFCCLFSKRIGWTMKNAVVSAEGQAAHKALRKCFSNSVLHHIYCTELTFTFALAVQEKINILFQETAIKGTIFASLLELLDSVIGCNSIFTGYWSGKGMVYFLMEREGLSSGMLRLVLKVTYLLVMGLRPDLLSTDLCSHSKSTLPFKTGAGESWSHTFRWNCYLTAPWKY